MATATTPPPKTNRVGLTVVDYRGGKFVIEKAGKRSKAER